MKHTMSHPASLRLPAVSLVLVAGLTFACKPLGKRSPAGDTAAEDRTAADERAAESFGAKLGNSPQVALAQVLAAPSEYQGKTIRVEGHVRRACSAKGCWMELSPSAEAGAPVCRVTFKDYGFFVPTDSAGARARVEGEVMVKRVRPAHVRHYEGEGATFAAKHEDGSADEVRFVATGVELRR